MSSLWDEEERWDLGNGGRKPSFPEVADLPHSLFVDFAEDENQKRGHASHEILNFIHTSRRQQSYECGLLRHLRQRGTGAKALP